MLLMVGTPGPSDHVEGRIVGSLQDCLAIEKMAQIITAHTSYSKLKLYRNYNDKSKDPDMFATAMESIESRLEAEKVFLTSGHPVFYGHETEKEVSKIVAEEFAKHCVDPKETIVILLNTR